MCQARVAELTAQKNILENKRHGIELERTRVNACFDVINCISDKLTFANDNLSSGFQTNGAPYTSQGMFEQYGGIDGQLSNVNNIGQNLKDLSDSYKAMIDLLTSDINELSALIATNPNCGACEECCPPPPPEEWYRSSAGH